MKPPCHATRIKNRDDSMLCPYCSTYPHEPCGLSDMRGDLISVNAVAKTLTTNIRQNLRHMPPVVVGRILSSLSSLETLLAMEVDKLVSNRMTDARMEYESWS